MGAAGSVALTVLAVGVTAIPFGTTVTATVIRQAATDQFGDPVGSPATHDIPGCVTWPAPGTENTDHADTVVATRTMAAPADADVVATDRVAVEGATWEVVGDPERYRNPFTAAELIEVRLRKVTG